MPCVSLRNSLGWLRVSVVKAVALMTLSYFVDESQLDLVRLDAQMLQFFLDNIQAALHSRKLLHGKWTTSEVIRGLSNLAKNDFNKRLMVCLLYTSPSPRDRVSSRMPSSA